MCVWPRQWPRKWFNSNVIERRVIGRQLSLPICWFLSDYKTYTIKNWNSYPPLSLNWMFADATLVQFTIKEKKTHKWMAFAISQMWWIYVQLDTIRNWILEVVKFLLSSPRDALEYFYSTFCHNRQTTDTKGHTRAGNKLFAERIMWSPGSCQI